jgi:hypothetical protein
VEGAFSPLHPPSSTAALDQTNPLLEMVVLLYVLSGMHQSKPDVVPAMIARRELFAVDAGYIMLLAMLSIVKHLVNGR